MKCDVNDSGIGDLHAVLASWLMRRESCTPAHAVSVHGMDAVLAACEQEGVLSLVHARLTEIAATHPVPLEFMQVLAHRARLCAVRSLLCVSEARRIQQALDTAGIAALWLKGIALGHWLYPRAHFRDIADIDLLLLDHATTLRAAEVLAPLGYALPNPYIAGDLVVHELLAWSDRAQLELDVHWRLSNDALFANRLQWQALVEHAIELPGLSEGARGLSPVHAFLHACLHRAINTLTGREDRLRWLYDIHLLALGFDAAQWQQVLREAIDAELADACASALRASQRVLATPMFADVLQALDSAAQRESVRTARLGSWTYFQASTLRQFPDMRTRLRWLRQLLFPDMAHLRARYGADGAGAMTVSTRRLLDGWRRWRGYHRAVE